MRILALGDVVGVRALAYLEEHLWQVRKQYRADFVIANGENATEIRGISQKDAQRLLNCGADVITLGNHAFGQKDLYPLLDSSDCIIRPANFPPQAPGMGYTVFNADGWRILCINACGRAHMDTYGDPFDAVQRILDRERNQYDYAVLDFHAEATSEKLAMARVFDGRIHVIFGTHTHVTTADEQILPKGSAYQTDLGMCGPHGGIIGSATEGVLERLRNLLPARFTVADGPITAHGTLFELDGNRAISAERITF
ncbi:MAG: YmdB family metallophosphoesterase [Ruminococcaceae bacterium]|nr:YmdB family metallophosphoesterase [Oscillospiraceae bacterium]